MGRTQSGKEPACCHNPRLRVKAPWGSDVASTPAPTKVWGPSTALFQSPRLELPDTLLRGLQEHQPKMYQAAAGTESGPRRVAAPFPEKATLSPGALCSVPEQRLTQPRGPRGPWGKQPGCQAPSSPLPRTLCGILDVDVLIGGCLSLTPQEKPFLR